MDTVSRGNVARVVTGAFTLAIPWGLGGGTA
jgi:hypothetical protein